MKITLITVGKIKEKFYRDAIAEYSKRLSRYCSLEILELPDEKTPDGARRTADPPEYQRGCLRHCPGDPGKAAFFRTARRTPGTAHRTGKKPYLLRDRRFSRTLTDSLETCR